MNPNMITTLSNVACIITILLLLNANYYLAAFFVLVSYYFDCMDGHLGCQELLYNSNESITLEPTRMLCSVNKNASNDKIKNTLLSTEYFGCGTFFI